MDRLTPDVTRLHEIRDRARSDATFITGRQVIGDILDALLASPPDGAAEREFRPTHRHLKSGRLKQAVALAYLQTEQPIGDSTPLQLYRDKSGQWWARPTREFDDGRFERLPTPAPGEAQAAGDGEAAIATRMALCREFVAQQSASSEWKDGAATGFYAGWNAALAARPAAVTDAMVFAAKEAAWKMEFRLETLVHCNLVKATEWQAWRAALTAALAARGPA